MIATVAQFAPWIVVAAALALPLVPYFAFNPDAPARAYRFMARGAMWVARSAGEAAERLLDGLSTLPRRVPGAALDPAVGGQEPPIPDAVWPTGWAEMPTDAHRLIVDPGAGRHRREVRVDDRRTLRLDWRALTHPDVFLIGKAA